MTRGLGRWAGDKVLAVWLAFEDIHTFQNLLESSYSLQITFFKQALVFFVRCSIAFCFSRPWVGRVDEIRIGLPWGSAWPLQRCSGLAGVAARAGKGAFSRAGELWLRLNRCRDSGG